MNKENTMRNKTLFRSFARYTILNVMSMIGLSCYILADTYFVSNGLGADGLTALNLAIPVYSFMNGFGLMLAVGGATKYAIFRAQGKPEEGNRTFTNIIWAAGVLSVIMVCGGLFGSGLLARWMGADENVFAMTEIYIRVILLFSPAFIFNNVINSFVRNDGNPKLSMIAMLAGSGSNVVMDYIFIFPMKMGMFGAVLATGFAPVIGLVILSSHFFKKQNGFHLQKERPERKRILSAATLGVPSLITEVSSGLVMTVYNLLILGIAGNVGVAAYGVIANIVLVVYAVYNGIAQGMQPVISDSYGKGEKENVRRVFVYGITAMLILSLLIYAGLFAKAEAVTLLFNRDRDMALQNMAVEGIRIYFAAIPFAGFNILTAAFFASTEKALPAQIISLLRGIILVIPMAFLLANVWKLTGVWLSFAVTELLTAGLGAVFLKGKKKVR